MNQTKQSLLMYMEEGAGAVKEISKLCGVSLLSCNKRPRRGSFMMGGFICFIVIRHAIHGGREDMVTRA